MSAVVARPFVIPTSSGLFGPAVTFTHPRAQRRAALRRHHRQRRVGRQRPHPLDRPPGALTPVTKMVATPTIATATGRNALSVAAQS